MVGFSLEILGGDPASGLTSGHGHRCTVNLAEYGVGYLIADFFCRFPRCAASRDVLGKGWAQIGFGNFYLGVMMYDLKAKPTSHTQTYIIHHKPAESNTEASA